MILFACRYRKEYWCSVLIKVRRLVRELNWWIRNANVCCSDVIMKPYTCTSQMNMTFMCFEGICKLVSGGGAVLEHCPHRTTPLRLRTGAVLSSVKHWHAMLEHCLALPAVVSWSLSWVTVNHCLMTQSLLPWKSYTKCGNLRSSAPSTACQYSHSLSY